MKQSRLFTKTQKQIATDIVSPNAKLLIKAGFVHQEMAGVYSFLPLGLRVLQKIENIVRDRMNKIGAQEILLSALQPKENWQKTMRWDELDVLFKLSSRHGSEYALGPSHEEIVVPIAKAFISSYKDLPKSVYQIQTKFRDEKRAKSGLLRGREFLMKDLYSFHPDQADLERYYETMKQVYAEVFKRLSLDAILTKALGGTFSKFSHEFQVSCEVGEDTIYHCKKCGIAQNEEIIGNEPVLCCGEESSKKTAAEVGNIFKLKTKYSEPFELTYTDKQGKANPIYMGCYGIGISRLMGVVAEVFNDDKGLIWPEALAPYRVHLIALDDAVGDRADTVYQKLQNRGVEVLYDEREELRPGEKFADADLIGCPYRMVISRRTGEKIEVKSRLKDDTELLSLEQAFTLVSEV